MGRFRVVAGQHRDGDKTYTKGQIVESDRRLDLVFRGKFVPLDAEEVVDVGPEKDKPKKAAAPPSATRSGVSSKHGYDYVEDLKEASVEEKEGEVDPHEKLSVAEREAVEGEADEPEEGDEDYVEEGDESAGAEEGEETEPAAEEESEPEAPAPRHGAKPKKKSKKRQ